MTSRREAIHEIVGSRISQIGVVVRDFEAALEAHEAMGPFRVFTYDASLIPKLEIHGKPAEASFQLAMNSAEPQFELISPLENDDIYTPWLEEHGPGLHHLGFVVADVGASTERMEAAGYGTLMRGGGHGLDGDGAFAYHDTVAELGYVTETMQPPARRPKPTRIFGDRDPD